MWWERNLKYIIFFAVNKNIQTYVWCKQEKSLGKVVINYQLDW